jgi:serine/threonine-protein kinase
MAEPSVRGQRSLSAASRYELLVKLASGGMATVYVGRQRGAAGFWRLCAIKRAHPHLLEDPDFRRMLIKEAWLASRLRHANVVAVQDVEELEDELLLVMDYVEGASLAALRDATDALPARVVVRIVLDACAGLGAVHELSGEDGGPLGLVHRDVTPQNILVGRDGVARLADFGIAKSMHGSVGATATGVLKGKFAYMAPEYVEAADCDARSDVFSMGVLLWEGLTGERLFRGETEMATMKLVLGREAPPVSSVHARLAPLDAVVARALAKRPEERWPTAEALAAALESAAQSAGLAGGHREVGEIVEELVGAALVERRRIVEGMIQSAGGTDPGLGEHEATASVGASDRGSRVTTPMSRLQERPRGTAPEGSTFGRSSLSVEALGGGSRAAWRRRGWVGALAIGAVALAAVRHVTSEQDVAALSPALGAWTFSLPSARPVAQSAPQLEPPATRPSAASSSPPRSGASAGAPRPRGPMPPPVAKDDVPPSPYGP